MFKGAKETRIYSDIPEGELDKGKGQLKKGLNLTKPKKKRQEKRKLYSRIRKKIKINAREMKSEIKKMIKYELKGDAR